MESIKVDFSDTLYDIPFTCYFSFYLFLILKNRLKFIDWNKKPAYFKIAICQDFNILQLSRATGICRNSIRDAYNELLRFKLIEDSNIVKPEHKATRTCLVYNDHMINCFEEELGHVVYNSNIPYDHSTYNFLQRKYGRDVSPDDINAIKENPTLGKDDSESFEELIERDKKLNEEIAMASY